VDILPGGLLRAQDGRQSKDFRVLYQKTNKTKQTNSLQRNKRITRHFIEFVLKKLVSSNSNVVCVQLSSMVAGSKRRALEFNFSIRICQMLQRSKCRVQSDLGLCTTSVIAVRMPMRGGDFRLKNVFGCKIGQNLPRRDGILFASNEVVHRPRSHSPLHFDIGTCGKFARKNKMWALGICLPQPCSSAGRRFAS